jgi:hypothetical protein
MAILSSNTGRSWWNERKQLFNSAFVRYVDAQLEKGDWGALHPTFLQA